MNSVSTRLIASLRSALPKAFRTVLWLFKIILPVGLAVNLLHYWGLMDRLAGLLTPAFSLIGLPGESALVFISSVFLNIYAAIAVIATLPLTLREITILALMCLISHNMIVETAIQKKTGSSALIMLTVRLGASFAAAFALNGLLPERLGPGHAVEEAIMFGHLGELLRNWAVGSAYLILKITLIVTSLMALQNVLKEFKILDRVSSLFAPLMRVMGLSEASSFLWFVGQTLGLAYGAAVMIEAVEQREIGLSDCNRLNYHLAINHSLLEDTLLFVAIGVPALWITAPRVALAMIVVWGVRALSNVRWKNRIVPMVPNTPAKPRN